MSRPQPIALVFSYSLTYCRSVLRGIREFASGRPDWTLVPVTQHTSLARTLRRLRPRGVIAHVYSQGLAGWLSGLQAPVVNVSAALPEPPFPRVGIDERAIGEVAAAHLLNCGFIHFGYYGPARRGPSGGRHDSFERYLRRHRPGSTFHASFVPPSKMDPADTLGAPTAALRRWVLNLPKPVAVFAHTDAWGFLLSEVCRQEGLRVPQDVAIIGADNDDLLCELARPSLSSIALPADRVGFEAARLLGDLMAGKPAPRKPLLLSPTAVVPRQSSDILAIDDPDLSTAIAFIRGNFRRPITVGDVLDATVTSRSSLERRFRAQIGHGPSQEIRRLRIETAKRLLADTTLSMPEIARQAGFSSAKQLSVVFARELGQPPSTYRKTRRPVPA